MPATGIGGEVQALPPAPGSAPVQQTVKPAGGAPQSAAMPSSAVDSPQGVAAGGPPPLTWQGPVGGPPRGAGLMNPWEQAQLGVQTAGATAEATERGKIRGALGAIQGSNGTGAMQPADRALLTQLGILHPLPPPTYTGSVRFEDLPPEEQARIPDGKPGQFYRQEFDRISQTVHYTPTSPISMAKGVPMTLANPARNGAPSHYFVYQDGTKKYLGDVSEREQNISITHPDGSQEIMRIPPGFLKTSGGQPIPEAGGTQGPSVAAPGRTPGPPAATKSSRAGGGPPPAPNAAQKPAGGSRGGISTKPAQYEPVPVTVMDENGDFHEAQALHNPKGPGPYIHPATGEEMQNVIPGKVGEGTIRVLAQAKATNDLIDRALAAIEPIKGDNTLEGTLKFSQPYRSGKSGADPLAAAQAALSDLAGLQASNTAALQGSSRALRYYTDKRQHVPILPSPRETTVTRALPAGAVSTVGQLFNNPSWDSPASIYGKLQLAKTNNENFRQTLLSELGKTSGQIRSTGGAPPAPKGAKSAVPPEVQDLLRTQSPGEHTLSDGSVWIKGADGSIKKAG